SSLALSHSPVHSNCDNRSRIFSSAYCLPRVGARREHGRTDLAAPEILSRWRYYNCAPSVPFVAAQRRAPHLSPHRFLGEGGGGMPEREDLYAAAGLLLRRMRELADRIAESGTSLAHVREETAQITERWNALMDRMKPPPEPPR